MFVISKSFNLDFSFSMLLGKYYILGLVYCSFLAQLFGEATQFLVSLESHRVLLLILNGL